jgi:hypothetical protein
MKPVLRQLVAGTVLAAATTAAFAQPVISARSGMIQYTEGGVFLNGQRVQVRYGHFPQISSHQVLQTTEGRAEVLLTPGVFLRAGQNSSFHMLSNRLSDTRLSFLGGSIILEAERVTKQNPVSVIVQGRTIHLRKAGIYRLDAGTVGGEAQLRVFKGSVKLEGKGGSFDVAQGRLCDLNGGVTIRKFDPAEDDALSKWSHERAEYIAKANLSAVKSLRSSYAYLGFGYDGWYNCADTRSGFWAFSAALDIYTYIPCSGRFSGPYGYRYWSPEAVYGSYTPHTPYDNGYNGYSGSGYNPGGGYSQSAPTSSGYSGSVSEAYSGTSGTTISHSGGDSGVSRGGSQAGGGHR